MNLFDFIKNNISIVEIISQVTTLSKIGSYLKGSCPFHSETDASFTVSGIKETVRKKVHVTNAAAATINTGNTSTYGIYLNNFSSTSSKPVSVTFRMSGGGSANHARLSAGKGMYLIPRVDSNVNCSAVVITCSATSGASIEMVAFGV